MARVDPDWWFFFFWISGEKERKIETRFQTRSGERKSRSGERDPSSNQDPLSLS
jgi:hypothetical protein